MMNCCVADIAVVIVVVAQQTVMTLMVATVEATHIH